MWIGICAGESSGDIYGANLMKEIKNILSDVSFWGIGGKRMIEEKLDFLFTVDKMAVVGFSEVILKLPFFIKTLNEMERMLKERKPAVLILIDYPGYNIRLAVKAKRLGIPVIYFISPQVWAWGSGRVKKIRKIVDRMIVILPFEEEVYKREGVKVDFVGHPLLDLVKTVSTKIEFFRKYGFDDSHPLVGILPGSRKQEMERIGTILFETTSIMREKKKNLQFVLGLAESLNGNEVFIPPWVKVIKGATHDIMRHSDLLLVASGTATLEAGIIGTPLIIVYRTSLISWIVGKILVNIPYIGLVNIVAGKRIAPEFIQFKARAKEIAEEALFLISDERRREKMKDELNLVKGKLGVSGALRRAAEIIVENIKK